MRPIEFRAYHAANKTMGYDLDLSWNKNIGWIFVSRSTFFKGGTERFNGSEKSCHLMEYTGLKDKNGKKIFEGDIVIEEIDGEGCPHPVCWIEDRDYLGWNLNPGNEIEVVGNIYENTELLK
jgi:hypothetical protein